MPTPMPSGHAQQGVGGLPTPLPHVVRSVIPKGLHETLGSHLNWCLREGGEFPVRTARGR